MKHNAWKESFMRGVFFIAACASVLAVALICIFLFANGFPAMKEIGFGKFLSGTLWRPKNNIFGILPMIVGSLYVTAGAIIFGVPIGILTSVYMAHYCPKQIYRPLKMATELLAGIPSVVYGFFGLVVLVPWIRNIAKSLQHAGIIRQSGNGNSILTASLLLGMMILPTIIGDLLKEGKMRVEVRKSHDEWFGVTYKEDKPDVVAAIQKLIKDGVYPEKLF